MKKINICFILLFAALAFTACQDDTNTYVSQLFTNVQKESAYRACLEASVDSAVNHLCNVDGFYMYNDAAYRIDYASLQNSVFDSILCAPCCHFLLVFRALPKI